MATWRERAHQIINGLYRDGLVTGTPEEQRRALLRLYPWGERAMHPYKAWLRAVRDRFPNLGREKMTTIPAPLVGPKPTRRIAAADRPPADATWSWSQLWAWRVLHRRVCGLCEGDGCLLCRDLRKQVVAALSDERLRALVDLATTAHERAMVADALADAGYEIFADVLTKQED